MVRRLKVVRFVPSLGDFSTTVSHPAVASHRERLAEERRPWGLMTAHGARSRLRVKGRGRTDGATRASVAGGNARARGAAAESGLSSSDAGRSAAKLSVREHAPPLGRTWRRKGIPAA